MGRACNDARAPRSGARRVTGMGTKSWRRALFVASTIAFAATVVCVNVGASASATSKQKHWKPPRPPLQAHLLGDFLPVARNRAGLMAGTVNVSGVTHAAVRGTDGVV